MRTCLLALLALPFASSALAHILYERVEGKKDCRAFVYDKRPVTSFSWTGACKDGYAEGSGVMEWKHAGDKAASRYEGGMRRGRWHGDGYYKLDSGEQYEGGFSEGQKHGAGTELDYTSRYEGSWVSGHQEGFGKVVYTLGGSYEGQWKDGKYHGKGKVTYAGGRTLVAEFVEGRRVGQAPAVAPSEKEYRVNPGVFSVQPMASSKGIPFSRSYDEMSGAEKQGVRDIYLLDDDDEPPYPANGTKRIYQRIGEAQGVRLTEGHLYVHVNIDSQGNPTSVTTFASPDPAMTRLVSHLLVTEKYKPGICQGKPCAMSFPISVAFTAD